MDSTYLPQKLKEFRNRDPRTKQIINASLTMSINGCLIKTNDFLFDSGASIHMINVLSNCVDINPFLGAVFSASGERLNTPFIATKVISTETTDLNLQEAVFCAELHANFISILKLAQNNLKIIFEDENASDE